MADENDNGTEEDASPDPELPAEPPRAPPAKSTPPLVKDETNGRKVIKMPLITLVAAGVAAAVIGTWLFVFMKIALGGLKDPATLANSEALIAILVIVGGPATIIINKVMDKWLSQRDES